MVFIIARAATALKCAPFATSSTNAFGIPKISMNSMTWTAIPTKWPTWPIDLKPKRSSKIFTLSLSSGSTQLISPYNPPQINSCQSISRTGMVNLTHDSRPSLPGLKAAAQHYFSTCCSRLFSKQDQEKAVRLATLKKVQSSHFRFLYTLVKVCGHPAAT